LAYGSEHLRCDADAGWRDAGRCDNCVRIGMDRKEVGVKRVVMCGTEWQPIAPIVGSSHCYPAAYHNC
jgi:hypothetical protein